MIHDLFQDLKSNPYPGRGILLGRTPDGKASVAAYFIMGRSENSRNRIFTETEDGIRTQAYDPSKMTDPSLIIYHPVRVVNGTLIVTNGDQTDTVADAFKADGGCVRALRTRAFEPDSPNFTPRISGMVRPDGGYRLSILKSAEGNPASCQRFFYEYDCPVAGRGHLIHTYQRDGSPLPSFEGEPKTVVIETNDCKTLGDALWNSLNGENKVSLYVRFTNLAAGTCETLLYNKHLEEA